MDVIRSYDDPTLNRIGIVTMVSELSPFPPLPSPNSPPTPSTNSTHLPPTSTFNTTAAATLGLFPQSINHPSLQNPSYYPSPILPNPQPQHYKLLNQNPSLCPLFESSAAASLLYFPSSNSTSITLDNYLYSPPHPSYSTAAPPHPNPYGKGSPPAIQDPYAFDGLGFWTTTTTATTTSTSSFLVGSPAQSCNPPTVRRNSSEKQTMNTQDFSPIPSNSNHSSSVRPNASSSPSTQIAPETVLDYYCDICLVDCSYKRYKNNQLRDYYLCIDCFAREESRLRLNLLDYSYIEDDERKFEVLEYHCNRCLSNCTDEHYRCNKFLDYHLCPNCLTHGEFELGLAPRDFILVKAAKEEGMQVGNYVTPVNTLEEELEAGECLATVHTDEDDAAKKQLQEFVTALRSCQVMVQACSSLSSTFASTDCSLLHHLLIHGNELVSLRTPDYCIQLCSLFEKSDVPQVQVGERDLQHVDQATVLVALMALSADGSILAATEKLFTLWDPGKNALVAVIGWHFPELENIVNDNYLCARVTKLVKNKSELTEADSHDCIQGDDQNIDATSRSLFTRELLLHTLAEFPFHLIPKLGTLGVAGGTIKGYGCPGISIMGSAITLAEVARVDASCSTFILVHSSLAMLTIALCGSEEQKKKYLPSLAQLRTVACWALTEPDYGSVQAEAAYAEQLARMRGEYYAANVPLDDGINGESYQSLFKSVVAKVMEVCKPCVIWECDGRTYAISCYLKLLVRLCRIYDPGGGVASSTVSSHSEGGRCIYKRQASDSTHTSDKDDAERGFTSAVVLPTDQGLLGATGGTDAVINLWHDSTVTKEHETFDREQGATVRGQELENAKHQAILSKLKSRISSGEAHIRHGIHSLRRKHSELVGELPNLQRKVQRFLTETIPSQCLELAQLQDTHILQGVKIVIAKIWSMPRVTTTATLKGHSRNVYGISFHPDGSLVAPCGLDALTHVGDLCTGRSIFALEVHVKPVFGVSFSPIDNLEMFLNGSFSVDTFLEHLSKHYEIVICSDQLSVYVDPITDKLDQKGVIKAKLSRPATKNINGKHWRDLSKLNRDPTWIIYISAHALEITLQSENALPIRSWKLEDYDTLVVDLIPFPELVQLNRVYSRFPNFLEELGSSF